MDFNQIAKNVPFHHMDLNVIPYVSVQTRPVIMSQGVVHRSKIQVYVSIFPHDSHYYFFIANEIKIIIIARKLFENEK